jgi:hypothetical protein
MFPENPGEVDRQNLSFTSNPEAGKDVGRATVSVRHVLSPMRNDGGVACSNCVPVEPEDGQPEVGMVSELPVTGRTMLSLKFPVRVGSMSAATKKSWAERLPDDTE